MEENKILESIKPRPQTIKDVPVNGKFRIRGGQIYKKLRDGSHLRLNKPVSKKARRRIEGEAKKTGKSVYEIIDKHARGYKPNELA